MERNNLIVQLFVPTADNLGRIGTAYPVAKDVLLTAAHVIGDVTGDRVEARWWHQQDSDRGWRNCSRILWDGREQTPPNDVVLLDCQFPTNVAMAWVTVANLRPKNHVDWASEGFAFVGEKGSKPVPLQGKTHSMGDRSEHFHLQVRAPAETEEGWKGASGSPVFVEEGIIGVIVNSPRNFNAERFEAVPLFPLLENEDFRSHVDYSEAVDESHRQTDTASDELAQYAADHISRYEKLIGGRNRIDVKAVGPSGALADASAEIEAWVDSSESKRLALLGDPGSGKTYLLRYLCSVVAKSRQHTPVFINAGQLRQLSPKSREELLAFADPVVPPCSVLDRNDVVVIIDGLDELIGPTSSDQIEYADTLHAVGKLIPDSVKLIISCRSTTFDATSVAVTNAFGLEPNRPIDRTDEAIYQALRRPSDNSLKRITLEELTPEQASSYLSQTLGEHARNQASEYVLQHLPRVPVVLRLLELALPEIRSLNGRVDLDELYTIALRAWIFRDPVFADQDPESIWDKLTIYGGQLDSMNAERLVHAGLLTPRPLGGYAWTHYSIHEFLFSHSLFAEIGKYRADNLARLNLIGSYNINRFVVPMCRRQLTADSSDLVQPVLASRYRDFVKDTGWRRSLGYGLHPSYMADDGTGFISGTKILRPERDARPDMKHRGKPVSGVSWYDAFAYCNWSGECLPDSKQISPNSQLKRELWYWCADWSDERKAHISVVNFDGNVVHHAGVNPDVRHSKLALATVSPSSSKTRTYR